MLDFEWDEEKRRKNLIKHGLDFHDVYDLFDGRPVAQREIERHGELRVRTIGRLDDRIVAAVWVSRNDRVRLISVRMASHEERREYRHLLSGGA